MRIYQQFNESLRSLFPDSTIHFLHLSIKGGYSDGRDWRKYQKVAQSKRMTQKEVANQLNVTPQTISKWERNISYPDLDMLVKLSQLFHISTDALLGNTKPTFCFLILKKKRGKRWKKYQQLRPLSKQTSCPHLRNRS